MRSVRFEAKTLRHHADDGRATEFHVLHRHRGKGGDKFIFIIDGHFVDVFVLAHLLSFGEGFPKSMCGVRFAIGH